MTLRIGRFVEAGVVRGQPIEIGGNRLVPVAWTISLSLGSSGMRPSASLTWTRPIAVEVTDPSGWRRIPIVDVGARMVLGLISAAALLILVGRLRRTRRPSR